MKSPEILHVGHRGIRAEHDLPDPRRARPSRSRGAPGASTRRRTRRGRSRRERSVEDRDQGSESVENRGHRLATHHVEQRLRPVRVEELERHTGRDQEQEADDHQAVQEAVQG